MPKDIHKNIGKHKPKDLKVPVLFFIVLVAFLIFIISIFQIVFSTRHTPKLHASKIFTPLRGNIYSSEKQTLATSLKLYKASTNAGLIYENKKDLFAKVFAIYANLDEKKIREKLKSNSYVFLSYNLTAKQAHIMKSLSRKLYKLGVFKTRLGKKGLIYQGIEIQESGEHRVYLYEKSMSPILGYVRNSKQNDFIQSKGVKGIEKYYDAYLHARQSGEMSGTKDINSFIIFNTGSTLKAQLNGHDIVLNISLVFQKEIENILSKYKKKFDAKEVIVAIMQSNTGKIIALGSSNRFNPSHIQVKDYPFLNASAIEYIFEPGSVMKPIVLAKLIDDNIVGLNDVINGHNGHFKIKNKIITDEHAKQWFSTTSAIVYSSNIAMAQLGLKLASRDFYEYLKLIGFGSLSGIDLSIERKGDIPTLKQFDNDIYKATVSYGYGVSTNFMQLLRIYSMFANNGKAVTPRIVDYIANKDKPLVVKTEQKQIISSQTANKIKQILIQTTLKGTTRNAYVKGVEIGAKTGTAQVFKNGKYASEYISSVFGFANDKNNSYTIGVTTFLPKKPYFASQTSAKVFKDVVKKMIEYKYLTPLSENK